MTKSIEFLHNEIKTLVKAIRPVGEFYFKDFNDAYSEGKVVHPAVIALPYTVNISPSYNDVILTITVTDKVYTDYRNADDVRNDTAKILEWILIVISKSKRWTSWTKINNVSSAKYFRNKGSDIVDGWTCDISIRITSTQDLCAVPLENYDTNENLLNAFPPVSIFIDGEFYENVPAGSTVNIIGSGLTCELLAECPIIISIQESISEEILNRQFADSDLQEQIDGEQAARTNADNALSILISNEVTNRTNADSDLQAAIDTEASARDAADANLGSSINDLYIALDDHVNNLSNPHQTTLEQVRQAGNSVSGPIDMGGNIIENLPSPIDPNEPATKQYVDNISTHLFGNHTRNTTSSTSNALLISKLIPANTVKPGDETTFIGKFGKTAGTNTAIAGIGINSSPSLVGIQALGIKTIATASTYSVVERSRSIRSATQSVGLNEATNTTSDVVEGAFTYTSLNIDWTVDQYLIAYGRVTNAINVLSVESVQMQIQRANL